MSYVYGLGAVAPLVPFVPTPTREGDGFQSLFTAYKTAFPSGTTLSDFAKAIVAANGKSFTTNAIESWIFGISGKRQPFNPSNNPGATGGPKNVGFAFFGEGNVIQLPNIPRGGVVVVTAPPPQAPIPTVSEPVETEKKSPVLFIAAGGLLLLALLSGDKKKSGAAVSTASPSVKRWST